MTENRRHEMAAVRGMSLRWTNCLPILVCVFFVGASSAAAARADLSSPLVQSGDAAAVGLTRAWFSAVPIERTRAAGGNYAVDGDQLFFLTGTGMLVAMDASSGARQWTAVINNSFRATLGPTINATHVAVVDGGQVHVLKRPTGRTEIIHDLDGAPGAGPTMGADRVFVPLLRGVVQSFSIADAKARPWRYFSRGRAVTRPTYANEKLFWTTSRGDVYGASAIEPAMRFRFETPERAWWPPAGGGANVIAASIDGYVVALDGVVGRLRWSLAIGAPIARPPVAVGNHIFILSRRGELHCMDAATGKLLWKKAGLASLASVSAKQVYALGNFGLLEVLDRETGAPQGRVALRDDVTAIVNDRTDRVFLISGAGLIQCLHEIGQDEPLRHQIAPVTEEDATAPGGPQYPPADAAGEDEDNPFLDDDPMDDDDMFGIGSTEPEPSESVDEQPTEQPFDDEADDMSDDDLFSDDLFGD